jgi:hypothetical protein
MLELAEAATFIEVFVLATSRLGNYSARLEAAAINLVVLAYSASSVDQIVSIRTNTNLLGVRVHLIDPTDNEDARVIN